MTTALKLPSIIASRYLPVRLIAKGGMGAVYEVEHARTGEHLALKILLSSVGSSPAELERFKREARVSARIKSEHVVHVVDADVAPELDGAPFLVMELLEGADLERVVTSAPPSPALVVDWLRQVARALDKAHRLGIVHRDLKPENLFLATSEGRLPIVKVLDFGIMKTVEEGSGATGSGQIVGTPKYMAPEQASTSGRITPATDCYALGMVAYRLLAGETYYKGDVLTILAQLLHEPLTRPSQRNPVFEAVFDDWFMRSCHRDPEQRFASAGQQIEALAEAFALPTLVENVPRARAAGRPPRRPRPKRRGRRLVPVIIALAAAASLGAMLLNRPHRANDSPTVRATSSLATAPAVLRGSAVPSIPPEVAPTGEPKDGREPRVAGDQTPPPPAPDSDRPKTPRRRLPSVHAVSGKPVPEARKADVADPYADQK